MGALTRRLRPIAQRVSVVVPCSSKHVQHLPEILRELAMQTSPPDEVVVAVSGVATAPAHRAPARIPFLRILASAAPANAAQNRNRGTAASTGSVIVYQDADDLPHPQRIELLRHLFDAFDVDHVMHGFRSGREVDPEWRSTRRSLDQLAREAVRRPDYVFEYATTNGNPAVSSRVAHAVQWPEHLAVGEDVAFNRAACDASRACVVVPWPLLHYRQHLSAGTMAPS